MEGYEGEGPKWRLEHASTGQAVCNQAACKRQQVKIAKGEFRIGTHTLFETDGESRWYMAWRHWGCATKFQIQGLKDVTDNDSTRAAGFDRLSSEAQEQVRLAFENGGVADKDFKNIRVDLAGKAQQYGGEFLNATGYKVDIATRGTAGCRKSDCPTQGEKITKGNLRLGISVLFDGERQSWVYKHWKCISQYDLEAVQERFKDDTLDGISDLPEEYKECVIDTIEKGEVMEPPIPKPVAPKPKKRQTKKKANSIDDDTETDAPKSKGKGRGKKKFVGSDNDAETPKPKLKGKGKGKKRASDDMDDLSDEPEYVPKKPKSRAALVEETIDPAVARIQAMAEGLRKEAAN